MNGVHEQGFHTKISNGNNSVKNVGGVTVLVLCTWSSGDARCRVVGHTLYDAESRGFKSPFCQSVFRKLSDKWIPFSNEGRIKQ